MRRRRRPGWIWRPAATGRPVGISVQRVERNAFVGTAVAVPGCLPLPWPVRGEHAQQKEQDTNHVVNLLSMLARDWLGDGRVVEAQHARHGAEGPVESRPRLVRLFLPFFFRPRRVYVPLLQ